MQTKALTIHQPWASLIAQGVKTIEVRSWPTKHRGSLAIHASAKRLIDPDPDYPFSAMVGLVDVVDCRPLTPEDMEAACLDPEDFRPGLWAWVLDNPQSCIPVPMSGHQGLWSLDL